jgi:uroporphyrinogen III methyltransferase/synthase
MTMGFVHLVGAGPGDPALLTLRARQLLDDCDVVAYDELCSDALLAGVPATAELLPVGRRANASANDDLRRESCLHPDVLTRALAGKRVVRLKAGDPLIFGRGGEEAEELAAAGVPFEIVPGVSAALGAAAYAGIPLTHRKLASAVAFATGHEGEGAVGQGTTTLVLYMAGKKLAANLGRVIADGRAATTLAAYVVAATTARQRVIVATLADLPARVAEAQVDDAAPALVIVGDVVALRDKVGWRHPRPLDGKRILVGRARPGRSQVTANLAALGAEVLEAPDVTVTAPADWAPFDHALESLDTVDAIVFASAEAVVATAARLGDRGRDLRTLPWLPLVAIGAPAAAALRSHGLVPAVVAHGACADALADHAALRHGKLLVIADDSGRPQLTAELRALGAQVDVVAVYRHALAWPLLRDLAFDLVIAPSSSAAQHLAGGPHGARLRTQRWLAMGPLTEAAARRLGVTDLARAASDDVAALSSRAEELLS